MRMFCRFSTVLSRERPPKSLGSAQPRWWWQASRLRNDEPCGPSALRLMEDGLRPDVLVTDVGLPNGMDGRAVAEAARQRWPGLPVLFVTGYSRVALPDGAEVISKPFDLEALATRIGKILARQR